MTGRRRQLSAGNLIGQHGGSEAVKIRQEAQDTMNRDEWVFLLDLLLSTATTAATPSAEFSVRKRRQFLPKLQ